VFFRVIQPFLKAFPLLILADVQIEFDNSCAIIGQHTLEIVDMVVALAPDITRYEPVYPHDQYIFVMTAVENADVAFRRDFTMYTP
jgi:hypothetical protein